MRSIVCGLSAQPAVIIEHLQRFVGNQIPAVKIKAVEPIRLFLLCVWSGGASGQQGHTRGEIIHLSIRYSSYSSALSHDIAF